MECASGAPTCAAGTCPDTSCPGNGCGVGSCSDIEYGTYTSVSNTCEIIDDVGTCTDNACSLECAYSASCENPGVQCWEGNYENLYRNRAQMRKFCKCAEGSYGYQSYSYSWGRKTVYQYTDTGDNEVWSVNTRSTYLPVNSVKCLDGSWYSTNQDYFR